MRSALPPYPGSDPSDDLRGVVTRLRPTTTRAGRQDRDPNEPETRWLLEAGIRAMQDSLFEHSSVELPTDGYTNANGLFSAVPIDVVMSAFRRMCAEAGVDCGEGNKARLLRRWSYAVNYQRDLIAYVFRDSLHLDRMTLIEEEVLPQLMRLPLGELVDALAVAESTEVPGRSVFRLQQVLLLMFPNDALIRDLAARSYRLHREGWARMYGIILEAYGVEIPPGVDLGDVASMLATVVEGAFYRASADPELGRCVDGTPVAVRTIRLLLASVFDGDWAELAALRAR